MTTITIDRATVEQVLEALMDAQRHNYALKHKETDDLITALRAALAQQADTTDPGHDVDVLREHVRHLERRIRELHAQQAEPLTIERLRDALVALEFFRDTAICSADTEAASEAIAALRAALAQPNPAQRVVDEQAEDEGLWFRAQTAAEAYLQQELRRLHAAVEGEK